MLAYYNTVFSPVYQISAFYPQKAKEMYHSISIGIILFLSHLQQAVESLQPRLGARLKAITTAWIPGGRIMIGRL